MKNNKWYFLIILIIILFSINVIFSSTDIFEGLTLINNVRNILKEKYVEPNKIDEKDFSYSAVRGMLDNLDTHSVFFTPEESQRFLSDIEGSFGGVGIQIDKRGDYIVVVSPIDKTPAYKKGIKSGDKIVEVNGESVIGISMDGIMDKLRGKIGTEVKIGIMRKGVEKVIQFEIERAKIEIPSVTSSFMVDEKIGYIKLSQFNESAIDEMLKNLNRLKKKGMKSLIFDLRYNPGGLLDMAYKISDLFIRKGETIVSTKGRDDKLLEKKVSTDSTPYKDIELAVLVNEGSASASEIFAGALKDLKRGVLIGEKTFGKGSVQKIYSLNSGASVKVTIAHYYTPAGICVDKKGIKPDIIIDENDYSHQLIELVKDDYFSKFAEKYHQNYSINDEYEINPDPYNNFLNFLEKSEFNFEKSFIRDSTVRKMVVENIKGWKDIILKEIKNDIKKRLVERILSLKYDDDISNKYLSKSDKYINKAIDVLNEKK